MREWAITRKISYIYTAHFFSRREKAKVGGAPYKRVQQNQDPK